MQHIRSFTLSKLYSHFRPKVTVPGRLSLPGNGYSTAPALDLFDTATRTELEHYFKHVIVMKAQPAQKAAEQ